MENCLFCKFIKHEIPVCIVYEDDQVLAFLDIHPSSPGHTMVIPKKHVLNLFELSQEETGELFEQVKKIALHIKSSELQPAGFNIGVNHWRAAGQEIEHLHVHIIPRWKDDGGGSIQSIVGNTPKESLEEILKKIKMN
ncbi:MAG: HIT family protein [Patescibacteria group bacterium]